MLILPFGIFLNDFSIVHKIMQLDQILMKTQTKTVRTVHHRKTNPNKIYAVKQITVTQKKRTTYPWEKIMCFS